MLRSPARGEFLRWFVVLVADLAPCQDMVNDISRQLYEGGACRPDYTPFALANWPGDPWKPLLSTHDRSLGYGSHVWIHFDHLNLYRFMLICVTPCALFYPLICVRLVGNLADAPLSLMLGACSRMSRLWGMMAFPSLIIRHCGNISPVTQSYPIPDALIPSRLISSTQNIKDGQWGSSIFWLYDSSIRKETDPSSRFQEL